MHLLISVICVAFSVILAEENGGPCVTPNKENATCISINSCPAIKRAIMYLDEDALEFAKLSQCGYDGAPLVCCGSVGTITNLNKPTTPLPKLYEPTPAGDVSHLAEPVRHALLPDSSLCGLQSQSHSNTGRTLADIHEYPWLVTLRYHKNDGSPGGFRCSGTLINQRYILTAAQCLEIPGYNLTEVRVGEWDFTTADNSYYDEVRHETVSPKEDLIIVDKIPHPYYNSKSGNNDIALVQVGKKIKYNQFVRPICLPIRDFPPPPAGAVMESIGWNTKNEGELDGVKVKANFTMVSHEQCNLSFVNYTYHHLNKACVHTPEINGFHVQDSGRPLMRNYVQEDPSDERQWYQEGILYKGPPSGEKGAVVLYMKLSKFFNWILSNLKTS